MRSPLFLILLFFYSAAYSQLPYTTPLYPVDTVTDIVYGLDSTFDGGSGQLVYDMYRPVGDSNCLRPIAVVIHGGAWVAGTQRDPTIAYISSELARRGWLAVAPQYRLGNHKITNYSMYALCNASLASPCAYAYDTAEVIRANFRGMQDIKGLLRFLTLRSLQDSSDMNNLFLIGESAGGFIALSTAFTDRTSEKPVAAGQLSNAPPPDPDMYLYGCLPTASQFNRPDLGSIRGNLSIQVSDPAVRGVASIFGGVMDSSIFIQNGGTPRVFLFHQGSDVIVNYNYGRLLSRISAECFAPTNYCQPIYNYPFAWGGEGIRRIFNGMGAQAPVYRAEIVSNYEYGNDCFDNGHSIDVPSLRFGQLLQFFSEGIDTTYNQSPNACLSSNIQQSDRDLDVRAFVSGDFIHVGWEGEPRSQPISILSADGREVALDFVQGDGATIDVSMLATGIYIIRLVDTGVSKKVFIE